MARTNTGSGGEGGGTFSSITGGATQIAYFDALGNGTSDADHTLLADGTLNLQSTFGDMTGRFVQRVEPKLGNTSIWGMNSLNNSTDAEINIFMVDGTNSTDFGNDSALLTVAMFPSTDVRYQQFITNAGTFLEVGGPSWNYYHSITGDGYEVLYDDGVTSGGAFMANLQGAGALAIDLTSSSSGYLVDAYYGQVFADDTGATTRVATGKDIVDYVQNGSSNSVPGFFGTGLDDFSVSGSYTGSFTGSYTVTCIGNDGSRVAFNGGMAVGPQFNVGETVTGQTSGTTAKVSQGVNDTRIWVYDIVGPGFQVGEIIDDGLGGNVSTAVTSVSNGPGVGDLFQVNYQDFKYTQVQWFTGNQSPFPGIGGMNFVFGSPTGHTPNDAWSFTASANYEAKQTVDTDGTTFTGHKNGTTTHSNDIPLTQVVSLTKAQIDSMNTTPINAGITVPLGYICQILEVIAYSDGINAYATNTTLSIAYQSAPTQSVWQNNNILLDTTPTYRRFTKTSGSGAEVVIPDKGLLITNTVGDPTSPATASNIDVYITYMLIAR